MLQTPVAPVRYPCIGPATSGIFTELPRRRVFSETREYKQRAGAPTAPVPRISFALEHLDQVCWARRHGLGVSALAVTSYTGKRGIAEGRTYVLFSERLPTARARPF